MIISTSPQNPDDTVLSFAAESSAAVAAARDIAQRAQQEWASGGAAARATALIAAAQSVADAADDLADLVVREVGKPITEARGEVARAIAILRYYAQQAYDPIGATHSPSGAGMLVTSRRPRGVAGLVTPWNFPIAIPLWKAAPALAYGNSVLLKPAEQATACAVRLAELIGSRLPDGLFTVLPGSAETGQAVVRAADVVSFTGSTAVGRTIVTSAAGRGVPVQAEMGGQNATIVLPDADHARAAADIAGAVASYAGQKCTATKRIIVVGDASGFSDELVGAVQQLAVGDPAEVGTVVGPVITEAARDRIADAAADVTSCGGRLLTQPAASAARPGWFVSPVVAADLPDDHILERDEVFGPICSVSSVPTLDHAFARANRVRHGLVAALYSRDLNAALDAAERLDAGLVKVNAPTTGVDFYLPFGGVKDSSYGGREQGKAAVETFTCSHTISLAPG